MFHIFVIFVFMGSWQEAKRILRSNQRNLTMVNYLSFQHCGAKRLICSRSSLAALEGIKATL